MGRREREREGALAAAQSSGHLLPPKLVKRETRYVVFLENQYKINTGTV